MEKDFQGDIEYFAQRSEIEDVAVIEGILINTLLDINQRRFGTTASVAHLIEILPLSITIANQDDDIIGYTGFSDFPETKTSSSKNMSKNRDWDVWYEEQFVSETETGISASLWIVYFVSHPSHGNGILQQVLCSAAMSVPVVQHFHFALPPRISLFQPLTTFPFHPSQKQKTTTIQRSIHMSCRRNLRSFRGSFCSYRRSRRAYRDL